MSTGKIVALGSLALVVLVTLGSFNSITSKSEDVGAAWSEVQNQLKRRNDLIPNLVETVKGYAAHESGVFERVADARSRVAGVINIDASKLANDPALQKQLADAQQGLSASLGRLIAVAENYPTLKAGEDFLKLQDELSGTENRIGVARNRAIDSSKEYNKAVKLFPGNVIARFFGFAPMNYYEAPESEQKVPVVKF